MKKTTTQGQQFDADFLVTLQIKINLRSDGINNNEKQQNKYLIENAISANLNED